MKKFQLKFGYAQKEDGAEIIHKDGVFSKRPTADDYISAMERADGSPTLFQSAIYAHSLSKLGDLTMPVTQTVLLSLNRIDRQILEESFQQFLNETAATPTKTDDGEHVVTLSKPVKIKGKTVSALRFERLLTGYAEIEIEQMNLSPARENAERVARELSPIDGANLSFADLAHLDAVDFQKLLNLEVVFLDSFRD